VRADPQPRELHRFAPRTWVRSSIDAAHYIAIEPAADQSVTLWFGSADGSPPVALGTERACASGEDRLQFAELTATVAGVFRCGVVTVYDVATRRKVPISDPERIAFLDISHDGRWLGLARSDGVEIVEIATGASWRLAGGAATVLAFSNDGR